MLHHTIITAAAWVTFAVLLWGRVKAGWQGAKPGNGPFGFALLAIGYFGSKFVIEVLVSSLDSALLDPYKIMPSWRNAFLGSPSTSLLSGLYSRLSFYPLTSLGQRRP